MLIEHHVLADPLVLPIIVVAIPDGVGHPSEEAVCQEQCLDVLLFMLLRRKLAVMDVELPGIEFRLLECDTQNLRANRHGHGDAVCW